MVLAGPTASGKTDISLQLAQRLKGEIVSADSMLIYRGMDIGTAKPSLQQQKLIPHHMIDIVEPDEQYNAALYCHNSKIIIKEVYQRGNLPIMVGGTGLYINGVIDNYVFTEAGTDLKLREKLMQECEEFGKENLFKKLQKLDPYTASTLHENNVKRIIRALEVYYLTGKTMSQSISKENKSHYNLLFYGLTLDRKELYRNIEKRVDKMLESGLVDEVASLLDKGYSPQLNSMQGLGYKEIVQYIKGELSLEQSIDLLKMNTRRFAKRQLTWFKKDNRINWIYTDKKDCDEILSEIARAAEGVF